MKFFVIGKGKGWKIFDMGKLIELFRNAVGYVREKKIIFESHVASGTHNSLITIGIIVLAVTVVAMSMVENSSDVMKWRVELAKTQLAVADRNAQTETEKEQIRADAKVEVAKQQARAEEARASMNPYVAMANHGKSTQPVNVFINSGEGNYAIQTSDGATEIAISTITVKGMTYTPEQRKLMEMAFYIGRDVGFPETIEALLLQETMAGALGDRIGDVRLPVGKRSYGVMQVKVATARQVMKSYPALVKKYFPVRKELKRVRDEEIIIKLIQDDEFNIRLAALNFAMRRKASRSWSQAVVAYNTGQGAANHIDNPKQNEYYQHIVKKLVKDVRPFNRKAKLPI